MIRDLIPLLALLLACSEKPVYRTPVPEEPVRSEDPSLLRPCAAFLGDDLLGLHAGDVVRLHPDGTLDRLGLSKPVWLSPLPDDRALVALAGSPPTLLSLSADGPPVSHPVPDALLNALSDAETLRRAVVSDGEPRLLWWPSGRPDEWGQGLDSLPLSPDAPRAFVQLPEQTDRLLAQLPDGSFLYHAGFSKVSRIDRAGARMPMPDLRPGAPLSEGGPPGQRWLTVEEDHRFSLARVAWSDPPEVVGDLPLPGRPTRVVADADGLAVVVVLQADDGVERSELQVYTEAGTLLWTRPLEYGPVPCLALQGRRLGMLSRAGVMTLDRGSGAVLAGG